MAEQEPSQIKSDILMRVRGLYLVFIVVVVIVLMRQPLLRCGHRHLHHRVA